MDDPFRPWGPIDWLLPKLADGNWSLLGVLGTEDRCTATLSALKGKLSSLRFLKIQDPQPSPPSAFAERYEKITATLLQEGATANAIHDAQLLQDIDSIRDQVKAFLDNAGSNIILDITSMPKWWFFPVIRFLLSDKRAKTVVVTYASAQNYGNQLSSDSAALAPLPTFNSPRTSERYDELVVGIGFATLGLRDLYEADLGKIRYLFPFPPGPPNYFRNWGFLRTLDAEVKTRAMRADDRWNLHMYDVPSVFEALRRFTKNGERSCALAPFGPKTFSLAMCLYALAAEQAGKEPVHVYYTQPRRYALDYTTGIKLSGGSPDITAYCVRVAERDLYHL